MKENIPMWAPEGGRATYHLSSALFLRLIGLVYLFAFISFGIQITGLVGESGILPAGEFLAQVESNNRQADEPMVLGWRLPTLAWLSTSDQFLSGLCTAGAVLSLALMLGVVPLPILCLLWLFYVSLIWIGQIFLSFQWDILLVEAGFLAIWMAPSAWRSRFFGDFHPPWMAIWLVWWLLFRLLLESGLVKLTWDDPYPPGALGPNGNAWEELTALVYHYWTQPLPLASSWWMAKLPLWIHKASVVGLFLIEIGLPFCIFGPRRCRRLAFVGFTFLMVLIASTGNYNFFNLLTVVLAVMLLDDGIWPRRFRHRLSATESPLAPKAMPTGTRGLLLTAFAVLVVVLSVPQLWQSFSPPSQRSPSLERRLGISQFFLVNNYGLFRKMTETRPEIVIEGSRDGIEWQAYVFRWKPGELSHRPGFTGPHQPRLDWQMWFEALNLERAHAVSGSVDRRRLSPWFRSFIGRLYEAEPAVLELLDKDPFGGEAPSQIRISLYQYRFTTAAEKSASGHWWHRQLVWRSR